MVKALDIKTDRSSACRFAFRHRRLFFHDDGGALRKVRALMRVQSTKPEGAKGPRMQMQSTKPEGAKRPRMRAQSAKPKGAKRPNRCTGMSAVNVGASWIYFL